MGETTSRLTAPGPLNGQRLTPRQLQMLLSNFGLNELSPAKARISLLAFIRAFPGVLQGHAALLLPTLKDIARHHQVSPHPHGLSFTTLSNSSLLDGRATPAVSSRRCSGPTRRQIQAVRNANSISLQEIIDSISSCCSGEAPETDLLLVERMLGRIAKAFQPKLLMEPEQKHVRVMLESIGGASLAPGSASTFNRQGSGSVSSSSSRRGVSWVSLGCSSRACVSLLQMLQLGYIELVFLLTPNSLLFQDPAARSTSGLSCSRSQEQQPKGAASSGFRGTAAWDSAPAVTLLFPLQLDFGFALRSLATACAEATAPAGAAAATPTAAAIAAAALSVTQLQQHPSGRGTLNRGSSSTELAAAASGAILHASTGIACSGGLRDEVFMVMSWIQAVLPMLPSLCTLGTAAHLLGDSVFDGQPQPERNDSSSGHVLYNVYASRRRRDSRAGTMKREGSATRANSTGNIPSGSPRQTSWKRSPSAESIAEQTKGWHGDGPLDARSKCLRDEHAFVLRLTSNLFNFPPKAPWTCLYASWKHGTSFSRLCARCFFYQAPMVLVVKTEEGLVLGAVISSELKDGGHCFFGDANTFLFSLEPQLNILRSSGLGTNYVYLNTKNKFHPIGLGFGGQVGAFRFWIGDEMKDCYITRSDCTFSAGRLLLPMNEPIQHGAGPHENGAQHAAALSGGSPRTAPPGTTDATTQSSPSASAEEHLETSFLMPLAVKEMEIWGAGDAMTLDQQRIMLMQQEKIRQERRQVDKGRFLDNNFDREFLLGGTFARAKGPDAPGV